MAQANQAGAATLRAWTFEEDVCEKQIGEGTKQKTISQQGKQREKTLSLTVHCPRAAAFPSIESQYRS